MRPLDAQVLIHSIELGKVSSRNEVGLGHRAPAVGRQELAQFEGAYVDTPSVLGDLVPKEILVAPRPVEVAPPAAHGKGVPVPEKGTVSAKWCDATVIQSAGVGVIARRVCTGQRASGIPGGRDHAASSVSPRGGWMKPGTIGRLNGSLHSSL